MFGRVKNCHNVKDFRELAKKKLPSPIFHYIDGAADDEITYKRNTDAFDTCDLVPNVLSGVDKIDMSNVSGIEVGGEDVDQEKYDTYKSEYETKEAYDDQEEYDEIIINYNKQKDTIQGDNDFDKFLNYLENSKM